MKNFKKGFTLIELLAVIIILAVIALIATPIVLNVVEKAKESSRQSSVAGYADAAKLYVYDEQFKGNGQVPSNEKIKENTTNQGDDVICEEVLYSSTYGIVLHGCTVGKDNTFYYFASGKTYMKDSEGNLPNEYKTIFDSVKGVKPNYKDTVLNGADPQVSEGMIPVYYDGNILKKADISTEWYNYTNKNWANVVLVNDTTIKDLPVGSVIDESKVLAHLVWIPRYKYAVPTGSGPRSINIVFENNTIDKSSGDAIDTNYLTHPAFTFGDKGINGIWVGKFETTGDAINPTIKPNITSLRSQNISTQFNTAQKFGTSSYGVSGVDAHMMKNTEWGAVAYLSHSTYGINKEIRINNNSGYTTGCGALADNAAGVATCDIKYGNASDLIYPQSTTGNITGIYDMSGGAYEYVMGNYSTNGKNGSGYNALNNSGFNGWLGSSATDKTDGIAFPESKYFDTYTTTTGIKGDATNSDGTNGWYRDSAGFIGASNPWFVRGGNYYDTTYAGVFNFLDNNGRADSYRTFRLVLI